MSRKNIIFASLLCSLFTTSAFAQSQYISDGSDIRHGVHHLADKQAQIEMSFLFNGQSYGTIVQSVQRSDNTTIANDQRVFKNEKDVFGLKVLSMYAGEQLIVFGSIWQMRPYVDKGYKSDNGDDIPGVQNAIASIDFVQPLKEDKGSFSVNVNSLPLVVKYRILN